MDHVLTAAAPAAACVILPAYNVAEAIGPLVRRVRQLGLEAIVVNDGSVDETVRRATEAGGFIISHVENRGKGVALRAGFRHALRRRYEWILMMDSDGQHDPEELPRLLEAARQTGFAIGHRTIDRDRMPRVRRATNRLMSAIVTRLAGQPIPDATCGFRCVHRRVLDAMVLRTAHYDLEIELLLQAAAAGWTIRSVPIRAIYQRQRSNIRPIVDGWRFLRVVGGHLLGRGRGVRPGRPAWRDAGGWSTHPAAPARRGPVPEARAELVPTAAPRQPDGV